MPSIEILSEILPSAGPLPGPEVRAGLQESCLEQRGWWIRLLVERAGWQRVTPPLTREELSRFVLAYATDCIRARVMEGEWAHSPFFAAYLVCDWFVHLWEEQPRPVALLAQFRDRFAALYREGDRYQRDVIVCGILEHLPRPRSIRQFFRNWHEDAVLREALIEAWAPSPPNPPGSSHPGRRRG